MATIRLYGRLKRFGTHFNIAVSDSAEAIRALSYQLPGFRQALQQGYYKVRIGKHTVTTASLEKDLGYKFKDNTTLHLTPVIKGAKSGGVFSMVLGAALVAFSFWNPLGWAAVGGTGLFAAAAQMPLMLGASLLLGGISQMLTKPPAMSSVKEQDKQQSTAFSNLANMNAQGHPVPLAYGEIMTGSLVISQGVETYDVKVAIQKAENPIMGIFKKG